MALSGVDDELGGHAEPPQALVEVFRLAQRDVPVLLSAENEGRRRHVVDAGDRGEAVVQLRILPGRACRDSCVFELYPELLERREVNRTGFSESKECVSCDDCRRLCGLVGIFQFGGRDMSDRFEEPLIVEPMDPVQLPRMSSRSPHSSSFHRMRSPKNPVRFKLPLNLCFVRCIEDGLRHIHAQP